ncbi:MAG: hypothetical protein ACLRYR_02135 [Bifidobacterium dentium]
MTDGTIEAAESPSPQTIEHALADGRVAVHDPAIAEENGIYYLFGTHRRFARSHDAVHWHRFENNPEPRPVCVARRHLAAVAEATLNPDLLGNIWAPDVIGTTPWASGACICL